MQLRKLTPADVEFTLEVEPECDVPLEGNCIASGDDEADRRYEQELLARLERDDISAWCVIVVKATWRGYVGHDSLGGVTLSDEASDPNVCEQEAEELAKAHDMYGEALAALNAGLQHAAAELFELVATEGGAS